jgi:hypothetical protein
MRISFVKLARRNCHHFTPSPIPNPVHSTALINTVQKQQKEIRELNDRLTKLTENIDERMEVLNDDIRLGYSLSCLLVVFSVAMRV